MHFGFSAVANLQSLIMHLYACKSWPMINGILLDISGVLYEGEKAVAGAAEAVELLHSAGLPVRFLTNTTRRPKRRLIEDLRNFGIQAAPDEVFTPVAAARGWLEQKGYSPHLLVHPDLEEDFVGSNKTGPVAVVVGDAAREFSYDNMNDAFRALVEGAPFLALASNRVFRDEDGQLSLDAGPFIKALEFASGVKATLFGKPSPEFFRASIESMDCGPEEAVMIGDDAESDVAGALAAGLAMGILVKTGKYRPGDENNVQPAPSAVVDDIAAAVDLIQLRIAG